MTPSEMGLALYVSLQGEAEPEAEHFDLKRVKDKDGVQHSAAQVAWSFSTGCLVSEAQAAERL